MLLMQAALRPLYLALPNAGRSRAARMARMAITTSNSINVKAERGGTGRPGCRRSHSGFRLRFVILIAYLALGSIGPPSAAAHFLEVVRVTIQTKSLLPPTGSL